MSFGSLFKFSLNRFLSRNFPFVRFQQFAIYHVECHVGHRWLTLEFSFKPRQPPVADNENRMNVNRKALLKCIARGLTGISRTIRVEEKNLKIPFRPFNLFIFRFFAFTFRLPKTLWKRKP